MVPDKLILWNCNNFYSNFVLFKVRNVFTSLLGRFTTKIWLFAECQIFCRVFFRALGKEALCRVPRKKPSIKENIRRKSSLPSILFLTLDKDRVFFLTLDKELLCRVSKI
jgi:hypothetical protein